MPAAHRYDLSPADPFHNDCLVDRAEVCALQDQSHLIENVLTTEDICDVFIFADTYMAMRLRSLCLARLIHLYNYVNSSPRWPDIPEPIRLHGRVYNTPYQQHVPDIHFAVEEMASKKGH